MDGYIIVWIIYDVGNIFESVVGFCFCVIVIEEIGWIYRCKRFMNKF